MTKLPRGFRLGHDDSLACPHRDCSTCDLCEKAHPEIVEVYGVHFWVADLKEREKLKAEMKSFDKRGEKRVPHPQ